MDNLAYISEQNGRPFNISGGLSPDLKLRQKESSSQLLTSINSRFKPSKKIVYYKRGTIALAFLALFLIASLIIVVTFYTKPAKQSDLCMTNECIRTAANLKYSMNFSVQPCDNFYDFCCGKWSQQHPNHGWYPTFSTFTTVTEKIVIESMKILGEAVEEDEPQAVSLAKRLYESCITKEYTEAVGLMALYDYLAMVNLPIVPSFINRSNNTQFNWVKTEVSMKMVLAMDLFIGFTVQPNIFKRDQNVIYLGILLQNCPLPSPFRNEKLGHKRGSWQGNWIRNNSDEEGNEHAEDELLRNKVRSNIIKYVMRNILKDNNYVGINGSQLQVAADIINNITSYIDELNVNYTRRDGENGEDSTKKFSFKELQEITDDNVENPVKDFWIDYISLIFQDTNVTIDSQNDSLFISETELPYLFTVLDYVSSQPLEHLELYMWWSAVYAMIMSTSSDITSYIEYQISEYYASKRPEDTVYVRSRSLDCSEMVNKYMGWAVSYAITDRVFANRTKPKVQQMLNGIKSAFVEHVQSITWMDSETKKVTLEKTDEMLSFIGYPEWLFEKGALDQKYAGLELNETTYLTNMINIILQFTNESLTSLRLFNPRDWSTEPITVNAFNSFPDNAINVPLAILNYPLYDLGLEVLNYGSIGSILGHELTHGFDNAGRKHDKYGNYVQWWSNKTIETFENLTHCFVKQYDNYTIEDVPGHAQGNRTLGENLADNGGLNQAFTAYKRYKNKHGGEPKLPGFEQFTSEQMFFISYGSIWCETASREDLKLQLEQDEHCPNALRVIGVLQNSEDFTEAFQCPRDSFMNPKRERCKIW
ncbi:endothelin-converting enzyme homolog [Euwallacea fornicatus]|uniref:endothelin-converting enzyme homolog n=1 Tax=Euwallacea fornicatus TaxID=995702 RepID=UPI00338E3048